MSSRTTGEFNLYPQSIDRKNSIFHGKAFSHFPYSSPTQLSTVAFALSNMSKKCFSIPPTFSAFSHTLRNKNHPTFGWEMCSTKNYTVYRHINTFIPLWTKKNDVENVHTMHSTQLYASGIYAGGRCRLIHAHKSLLTPSLLL
jgi:hypothetical protein